MRKTRKFVFGCLAIVAVSVLVKFIPTHQHTSTTSQAQPEVTQDAPSMHAAILNPLETNPGLVEPVNSFGSEKDLWKMVHQAMISGRPAELFEAKTAAATCQYVVSTNSSTANFVSGGAGSGIRGPLTPSRQLAVFELNSRCGGFLKAGQEATTQLTHDVGTRLTSIAGNLYDVSPSSKLPVAQIRTLLTSESPEARTIAAYLAADHWQQAMGVKGDDPQAAEIAQAIALATCDLSADCTPQGAKALTACAFGNSCDQQLLEGWQKNFNEEQVKAIQDYKNNFELAVNNRNWSILGLNQ